jgi:hypothetical protein
MPMERPIPPAPSRRLRIPPTAPDVRVKPRLRGVFHQGAFFVSLASGTLQVLLAPPPGPRSRPEAACAGWITMIFLLIAGTNTGRPAGPDWAQMAGCSRLLGRWLDRGVGHAAAVRPARRRRWIADRYRRAGLLGRGGRVCLGRPDPVPAVFGYHKLTRAGASAAADGVDAESSMSDTRIPARRPCRCS